MFSSVMKTFLNDSEEAKRNLRWQGTRHTIRLDLDLHTLPLAQLFRQLSHGWNKTQIFQTRRMQIVRHGLDVCRYAAQLPLQFAQPLIHFRASRVTSLFNSY